MTDASFASGLWPYFAVIVLGFLPSEIWRVLAVFLSRGLSEGSEVLAFVRAVATALLAGVVAKLLLGAGGALGLVPLPARIGALLVGLGAYLAARRSVLAGVVAGEAALIAAAWTFAS